MEIYGPLIDNMNIEITTEQKFYNRTPLRNTLGIISESLAILPLETSKRTESEEFISQFIFSVSEEAFIRSSDGAYFTLEQLYYAKQYHSDPLAYLKYCVDYSLETNLKS